jgi:hypothetical protein
VDGHTLTVNDRRFEVSLEPGAGARIELGMKRYHHQPTLAWPW